MHFTYVEPSPGADLSQGDVIAKTASLIEVLERIHPHYVKDDYESFLVLTQSCDLVRRGSNCSSPYITIAAVRPLQVVLQREAQKYRNSLQAAADVSSMQDRRKLADFAARLLNNNEPGYFYLHKDAAVGISESYCAFLRLSVPLRSREHYEVCLESRRVSLTQTFQAKLGWLVGNIFSRVGTDDWLPDYVKQTEWERLIEDILTENILWVDEEKLKAMTKPFKAGNFDGLEQEEIRARIASAEVKAKKDQIIDAVVEVVLEYSQAGPMDTEKLKNRLRNNPTFASLAR